MFKKLRLVLMTAMFIIFLAISNFVIPESYFAKSAQVSAASGSRGISVSPKGALFNMNNMAPGESRDTLVYVSSNIETDVYLSSRKESGDDMMYKKLLVTVKSSDIDQIYYKGNLADMKNILLDYSNPGQDRQYGITILFPEDAGNEYQGKSIRASLEFSCDKSRVGGVTSNNSGGVGGDSTEAVATGSNAVSLVIAVSTLSLAVLLVAAVLKIKPKFILRFF